MKILSSKLGLMYENEIRGKALAHYCPACEGIHRIPVEIPNHHNAVWFHDGDNGSPSFAPSINILGICHYFITNGKIIYCADSNHHLAGQTVELPDLPLWLTTF